MPSVTSRLRSLAIEGPIIEVLIAVSDPDQQDIRESGRPIPEPIRTRAVIDTGSAVTAVTPEIIERLGLATVGSMFARVPTTDVRTLVHEYLIGMAFTNRTFIEAMPAYAMSLGGDDIGCIIGRDLLRHAVLVYIGPEDQFTLSF